MSIVINNDNQIHFKKWLELNLTSISWEGRYLEDFNSVWDAIFEPNISIEKQFCTLERVEKILKQGPIIAWFQWIKAKFVCYVFIHHNLNIKQIVQTSNLSYSFVSLIIRDFFVDRYPHIEEQINARFQIGNSLSENMETDFKLISKDLNIQESVRGSLDEEVLTDLEVTLYPDWRLLLEVFVEHKDNLRNAEKALKDKRFIGRQIKFVQELVLLFIIGGILIFTIKLGNKAYEDYLVKKISLFSPNFFWLDKNLSFKNEKYVSKDDLKIQLDELEELEKLESKKVFEDIKSVSRYEVESDVVLTSVDTLPKDFEVAGLEQSNYEEVVKGGYRNSRYGRRKAYRVMMTSVNPQLSKKALIQILNEFKVKQVDNVKPGTQIPGGIYFNLYVPRKSLKEFLSKVGSFEENSTILESKTVFGGPANTSKVFIWIKSI